MNTQINRPTRRSTSRTLKRDHAENGPRALGRARFYRQSQRPEQLAQAGEPGAVRERRDQVQQPLVRLVRRQGLEQMRPGRRERGAVQVTGQVAAQLDGLPVLEARRAGEPALRGPGRVGLVLARRLGFGPLIAVRLQLAAVLALDRVVLRWPVRPADLLAHWHASL